MCTLYMEDIHRGQWRGVKGFIEGCGGLDMEVCGGLYKGVDKVGGLHFS